METRITISICDEEYTFVAEEAPSYIQKVGSYVNDKMSELLDAAKVGRTDAAVLTAVNLTDELFKEREAGDALRRQVKQYLDEASQAKNEVSELKREIFKLQQQKKYALTTDLLAPAGANSSVVEGYFFCCSRLKISRLSSLTSVLA